MSLSTKQIIQLRKERGWSQEKLAAVAGLSERTIQRVEKDGVCSLDTKMALALAFDVSPVCLSSLDRSQQPDQITMHTSLGGVVGLFVLGLAIPALVLLTGTHGPWELASAMTVLLITVAMSLIHFGAKATHHLFDSTSWIVRHPSYVIGLNGMIAQAKSTIGHAYLVGFVASIVTALSIAVHAEDKLSDPLDYFILSTRPLFYAMLFVEFWFRPFKRKMENMLMKQNTEG